jgi:hypothetical protein
MGITPAVTASCVTNERNVFYHENAKTAGIFLIGKKICKKRPYTPRPRLPGGTKCPDRGVTGRR